MRQSDFHDFVEARAADALGSAALARKAYASALAQAPASEVVASRALAAAIAGGDEPLALLAAHRLEKIGTLPPQGRLVLLEEALKGRNWANATAQIEALRKDDVYGFMAPLLSAWTAVASGKGDPLAILAEPQTAQAVGSYAAEQKPLLLIATGRAAEGIAGLEGLTASPHLLQLKIEGAALLASKSDRQAALSLLQGSDPTLAAAREAVTRGQSLGGSGPAAMVGGLLVTMASDLDRSEVRDIALGLSRLATFYAPDSGAAWFATAASLAAKQDNQGALAALAAIRPQNPYATAAADARVRLTALAGNPQQAIAEADALARSRGSAPDWTRLGDLYNQIHHYDEAAAAYRKALDARKAAPGGEPDWPLWLMLGGALEQGGHWPEAKVALEQAYKLAPDQPVVLNYLGYAQLSRRENIAAARALVEQASRVRPDDGAITDSLGWSYFLTGDIPAAIDRLERAVQAQPADPAINEHLGDAYYTAGRRFEARYAWAAALAAAEEKDKARLRAKIDTGLTPQLASP